MAYVMHQMDAILLASTQNSTQNTTQNSTSAPRPPQAFLSAVERHRVFARDFMPFLHAASMHMSMSLSRQASTPTQWGANTSSTPSFPYSQEDLAKVVDDVVALGPPQSRPPGGTGRRLLSNTTEPDPNADWKLRLQSLGSHQGNPYQDTSLGSVQAYSTLVAGAGQSNPNLQTYEDWLDGPYQWPPLSRVSFQTCPSGEAIGKVLVSAFTVLKDHVTDPKPVLTFAHQRVNATLPPLYNYTGELQERPPSTDRRDPLVAFTLGWVKSLLTDVIGFDMRRIVGFFSGPTDPGDGTLTASGVVKSLTSCDFRNVIDCQKKRANTFVGALAVLFILLVIYMSMGSVASLLIGGISVPLLVMWYVYGYSPTCVPMVPECAVRDLLSVVGWLIPLRLEWPAMLQKVPNCALDPGIPYQDCFASCMDPPFR